MADVASHMLGMISPKHKNSIWFDHVIHADISDLLFYLAQHDHVSGIQRVVSQLIVSVRESPLTWGATVRWSAVDPISCELKQLDLPALSDLIDEVNHQQPRRVRIDSFIRQIRESWVPIETKPGDIYVAVGAFWVTNATSSLLGAMQRAGLRTSVLIYDLIPVSHPEYCEIALSRNFRRQLNEILRFVDFAFTISEHVAQELTRYMAAAGMPAIPIVAVPLGHSPVAPPGADGPSPRFERLAHRDFVLAVGTVEVRKNHIYLINIWRRMLREQGPERTPLLIIAGRLGWRVADLMAQLEASDFLGGHVVMLHEVSDGEMQWLYQKCLFTTFASFVEGWGLPVGESLANGKLPVASNASSIPEVGGELAVYFDPNNLHDGYKAIAGLCDDPQRLAQETARIAKHFKPRSWHDVAQRLFGQAISLGIAHKPSQLAGYATLLGSQWLRFGEGDGTGGADSRLGASLACVSGWHSTEAWGRWASSPEAVIEYRAKPDSLLTVVMDVKMPPWMKQSPLSIHVKGGRHFRFPPISTDRDVVAFEAISDHRGVVSFVLETGGPPVRGEERMLFVGIQRVIYYEKSNLGAFVQALEQIALDRAGVIYGMAA